jgi:hypothetical protein
MPTQTDSYELVARDGTPFPATSRRNQAGAEVLHRADQIRESLNRIGKDLVRARKLIADADEARDWAALGYDSRASYVAGEFNPIRLKLTAEARTEVVKMLRLEGKSGRAIAAATGVSEPTVRRDLKAIASYDAPAAQPLPDKVVGTGGRPYPSHRPSQRKSPFGQLAAVRGVARRGNLLSQLDAVDLTRAEEMAGDPATWDREQEAVLEALQRLIDALERIETKVMT